MGKGLLGFQQQQCYGDDGMWMDTHHHAQQHQSHGFDHNNRHNYYEQKPFPGMHMMIKPAPAGGHFTMDSPHHHGNNKLFGGNHGMPHHATKPCHYNNGHHGYGNYGHDGGFNSTYHHQLSNGANNKFNYGGHHGGYDFEEYEEYSEEHHGSGNKVKVDEIRYELHNYGGGDHGYHAKPYGHHMMNMNMNSKPHHGYGGHHKAEWMAKGV